jgi:potassium/hydrogen antiporter
VDKITVAVMFLGALIFFAHFFNSIFDKTKVPNVLLLMIIGIISGFFIEKELFFGEVGRIFTTITLVVILFESGTSLKLSELKSAVGSATMVTISNFLLTIGIVSSLVHFLTGLNLTESIFLGAIVGGTSSAVVVPILNQLKLGKKATTVLLLESAFSDVLCLVVGLAALEAMKAGELAVGSILNSFWQSFLFAALIGLFSGVIWSLLLNLVRALKNSMFTTLAFVFIVYGVVELLGFNGGIAALSFGVVLGNSKSLGHSFVWQKIFRFDPAELNDSEQNFFSEIVFILQTYFFVYVGIVIEFGSPGTYLLAALLIALIILVRPVVIKLFARKDVSPKELTIMSIMSPKGLVPAVLASIPLQIGIASGQTIAELGYAIVLLSIVICSVLIIIGSKNPFFFNKIIRDTFKPSRLKKNREDNVSNYDNENLDVVNEEIIISIKSKEDQEGKKKRYKDEFDD